MVQYQKNESHCMGAHDIIVDRDRSSSSDLGQGREMMQRILRARNDSMFLLTVLCS
jgi:hypothetical protein